MIKSKMSKKLIYERLRKIEEIAPSAKPFIIFIEKGEKKNIWIVIEQYEGLNKIIKTQKYMINNIEQYMKNNFDIPTLVDYEINDNNITLIWHVLLQLANEEELQVLIDYMVELIDTNNKNINFTRYLIELTKKYKEKILKVNLNRPYDRLTKEQLKRLIISKERSMKSDV